MKTSSSALFDVLVTVMLLIFGAQGALTCFWPERWQALTERFPRGYNPDSPLGRMLERYRTRKATLADRLGGAAMLIMALICLVWFLQQVVSGRF